MTVLELLRLLRRRLNDLDSADDTGWITDDAGRLWSNLELVDYLNLAQIEHTRRVPLIDSRTGSICLIPMVAGVDSYAIDPRVISVERVTIDGEPLKKVFDGDADEWGWEALCPVEAYEEDLDQHRIRIYQTPTESGLLQLTVERTPLVDLSWDNPDATPEINARYHIDLLDWAAHLAYLKDSADTLRIDASSKYRDTFTASVGPRSSKRRDQFMKHKANTSTRHVKCYY